VSNWSPEWLLSNEIALVAGAMIVNQIADYITELKLGNGTSILIFANIASYLPSSIGAAFAQASDSGSSSIAIYMIAFVLTTFGIVCVQVCAGSCLPSVTLLLRLA
jgi:protein transport protein SEC61 subunit alpha